MTCTGGEIGGWTIDDDCIKNSNRSVYLSSGGIDGYNIYGSSIGGGKIAVTDKSGWFDIG